MAPTQEEPSRTRPRCEATVHQDKRTNIPTADAQEFVAPEVEAPIKLLYPRDPSLDPQLVWKGKDDRTPTTSRSTAPPIFIQEKIDPRVLVENLRQTAKAGRGRARADAVRHVRRPRRARHRRLLPARRQLVEPHDPRRLPAGDGITRRARGAPRQGPDDLHGPALRHQVRLELAGVAPASVT